MTRNPLAGTWKLVSYENRTPDGDVTYPLGHDATGYIMYTEDGYMSVSLMRSNRLPFAAGDLLKGSTEEKAAAVESYISYCGRYDFEGVRVIHHVEFSLFPNWIGGDQERFVELNENRLVLSASPVLQAGHVGIPRLVWERVEAR